MEYKDYVCVTQPGKNDDPEVFTQVVFWLLLLLRGIPGAPSQKQSALRNCLFSLTLRRWTTWI